jgi:glycosyltransferase involved in cell wall biosynthesis
VQNTVAAGLPVALASMITNKPFVLKFVGDEAWERAVQRKFTQKQLGEFLDKPEGDLKMRIILFIQVFVLRKASAVIVSSKFLGCTITEKYKLKKERVVTNYNPPERQEILPFDVQTRKHQIFTTGKFTNLSGTDISIKATAILRNEFPDVKFVIVGDGPETENLKRLALSLNLSQNVEFLGKVSGAEVWKIRKESEIYIFNLANKMSPQKTLVNFMAHASTIAADIPEINEIIENEKTGLLVKTYDEKSLAGAIEGFFKNNAIRQNIIRNEVEALKTKFSWNAHIKILNDIFKKI